MVIATRHLSCNSLYWRNSSRVARFDGERPVSTLLQYYYYWAAGIELQEDMEREVKVTHNVRVSENTCSGRRRWRARLEDETYGYSRVLYLDHICLKRTTAIATKRRVTLTPM